jgi:DNA-binding transcriptional regulator YdaS (Cro superfamily)
MRIRQDIVHDDPRLAARNLAVSIAGGPSALARQLGIRPHAISMWKIVPSERVLAVEGITGVSRHHLRPDVFGRLEIPA